MLLAQCRWLYLSLSLASLKPLVEVATSLSVMAAPTAPSLGEVINLRDSILSHWLVLARSQAC